MEYDQRDRRDPDAEDASSQPTEPRSVPPAEGAVPIGSADEPTEPTEPSTTPWDPDVAPTSPDLAPTSPDADAWGRDASPTGDERAWERQSAEPAWPTEPPAAGSGDASTWPTAAPERGDASEVSPPPWPQETAADSGSWSGTSSTEPMAADEAAQGASWTPAPEATEPPPSEVEAYSSSPETTSDAEPTERADDALTPGAAVAGASAAGAAGAAGAGAAHSVPATEGAVGESTKCPRCGTENRPGLAFCRSCGQRLVAAGVASTVERPGAPEGTMACPRCGTHNRAGVAFCQNCGANLRGTSPGYVPPAVAGGPAAAAATERTGGAVLGPVVLLIGLAGIVTGYLLPFLYGTGSLFERAFGAGGYGASFWAGYPDVGAQLADQAYFGLTGPIPLLGILLLALAIGGFVRARPGPLQTIGLVIALLWSVAIIVLFLVVEVAGNWSGDIVGMLRDLTPAGIIFFLASLIVLIGTLTRFARS